MRVKKSDQTVLIDGVQKVLAGFVKDLVFQLMLWADTQEPRRNRCHKGR
jgi:hypothetical protein